MSPTEASAEGRAAWDQYAAAILSAFDAERPELAATRAAEAADALLEERAKRFQTTKG